MTEDETENSIYDELQALHGDLKSEELGAPVETVCLVNRQGNCMKVHGHVQGIPGEFLEDTRASCSLVSGTIFEGPPGLEEKKDSVMGQYQLAGGNSLKTPGKKWVKRVDVPSSKNSGEFGDSRYSAQVNKDTVVSGRTEVGLEIKDCQVKSQELVMKAEENFEENYCLQKTNKLHDTNGVVNICTLNNHNKSARLCDSEYMNPSSIQEEKLLGRSDIKITSNMINREDLVRRLRSKKILEVSPFLDSSSNCTQYDPSNEPIAQLTKKEQQFVWDQESLEAFETKNSFDCSSLSHQ